MLPTFLTPINSIRGGRKTHPLPAYNLSVIFPTLWLPPFIQGSGNALTAQLLSRPLLMVPLHPLTAVTGTFLARPAPG